MGYGLCSKVIQFLGYRARLRGGCLAAVCIQHRGLYFVCYAVHQFARQFFGAGCSKANGIGLAVVVQRHTVVCVSGGQVQHVAWVQVKFLGRFEVGQNFKWHVFAQAQVFLRPNLPASAPGDLQQKHIVAVKMRPHTTALASVADHQVVQPRVGYKAKLLQQAVHAIVQHVYTLHQQRPVGAFAWRWFGYRAVFKAPGTVFLRNQAGLHRIVCSQCKQRVTC